ncbi:putative Cysteine proteinase [Aphelenchoides bicaudatus]|nr:putative Cysteine proteinase [Aphelenchoides bicaudatus]
MWLKVFGLLLLVGSVASLTRDTKLRELRDLSNYINSAQSSWTATDDHEFTADVKMQFMQASCSKSKNKTFNAVQHSEEDYKKLPKNYDVREKWGEKCPVVKHIRDQSSCGSCWAFGATEAISDRICIKSDGKKQAFISAAHAIGCAFGDGCDGGFPESVYGLYHTDGLVTGGDYNSKQGCWPYPFPQCAHHTNSTHYPACKKKMYPKPKCVSKCSNKKYKVSFKNDRHFGQKGYNIVGVNNIKAEIYKHGSIFEDFIAYKNGIYEHLTGEFLGYHAVKLIGWGQDEKGNGFWIVANSWNNGWGEKGFFKIYEGECEIEEDASASLPDFNRSPSF